MGRLLGHQPPNRCAFVLDRHGELWFLMEADGVHGLWKEVSCGWPPGILTRRHAVKWATSNYHQCISLPAPGEPDSGDIVRAYYSFILGVDMIRRMPSPGLLLIQKPTLLWIRECWAARRYWKVMQ